LVRANWKLNVLSIIFDFASFADLFMEFILRFRDKPNKPDKPKKLKKLKRPEKPERPDKPNKLDRLNRPDDQGCRF
jgi:hypothetical protein